MKSKVTINTLNCTSESLIIHSNVHPWMNLCSQIRKGKPFGKQIISSLENNTLPSLASHHHHQIIYYQGAWTSFLGLEVKPSSGIFHLVPIGSKDQVYPIRGGIKWEVWVLTGRLFLRVLILSEYLLPRELSKVLSETPCHPVDLNLWSQC